MDYLVHYVVRENGVDRHDSRIVTPTFLTTGVDALALEAQIQETEKGQVRLLNVHKFEQNILSFEDALTLADELVKAIPDAERDDVLRVLASWVKAA